MLGEGGMGKVFLAKDIKTRKKVAIKIVKDQDQWEREREILRKLNHVKGVPKLFFAGKEDDIFLVMEYIPGESFKRYIKRHGKLQKKDMVMWMFKICKVLEKIHKMGILHMDLKPENIILHPSGKIYLIDFGVSLNEGDEITGYGTKLYAPKIQLKAGEKAIAYMDIYSIGKMIELNMINKKMPDIQKIIDKCQKKDLPFSYQTISEVRRDLENIMRKAMVRKTAIAFLCMICVKPLYETQNREKRQKIDHEDEKDQNNIKKGMMYFYGNDHIKKDLTVAQQYFEKEGKDKTKAKAYLTILKVLLDDREKVSQEELAKALSMCQRDVYDFWSAHFFEHFYITRSQQLPRNAIDQAEKMLNKMQKYKLNDEKEKLIRKETIDLYEIMARKGNDKRFLQETDRIFRKKLEGNEAWEIYERKLFYLEEQEKDIKKQFEKFIKYYPKVTQAYIEYGIYLCRHHEIDKAKDIYLEGMKQTGMKNKRAQGLRRKLGL